VEASVAIVRKVIGFCLISLVLTGVCSAAKVYFNDDSVIDAESFWRRGDQVIVKRNRDVVLEFDKNEVDLKRTFAPANVRKIVTVKKPPVVSPVDVPVAATEMEPVVAKTDSPSGSNAAPEPEVSLPQKKAKVQSATTTTQPAPVASSPPGTLKVPPPTGKPEPSSSQESTAKPIPSSTPPAPVVTTPRPVQPRTIAPPSTTPADSEQTTAPAVNPWGNKTFVYAFLAGMLLMVVSMWVIFVKAGHPGIFSIIPIVSLYFLLQIAGKPGWWMLLFFIPFLNIIAMFLVFIALAQSFGKGVLFGLGLIFLPFLFFPILAFGGAEHQG
jgi:hypothetical protein